MELMRQRRIISRITKPLLGNFRPLKIGPKLVYDMPEFFAQQAERLLVNRERLEKVLNKMRSDWSGSPQRSSTQISQITDSLYLCSARAVTEGNVRALGITCVINVTLELPFMPLGTGMEYMKIQIMDAPTSNLASHFDAVSDKIWEVRRKGGRTLIHCVAGVSRSAALCMVYLMKYENRNLREAYHYVRGRRPIVRPNAGFFRQMIEYEKRLFGKTSVALVPNPVLSSQGGGGGGPNGGLIPDVYEEEYKAALKWHGGSSASSELLGRGRAGSSHNGNNSSAIMSRQLLAQQGLLRLPSRMTAGFPSSIVQQT